MNQSQDSALEFEETCFAGDEEAEKPKASQYFVEVTAINSCQDQYSIATKANDTIQLWTQRKKNLNLFPKGVHLRVLNETLPVLELRELRNYSTT